MARKDDGVDKVSLLIRNLLERFYAIRSEGGSESESFQPEIFFFGKRGGFGLAGREAEFYRECLEKIGQLHGRNPSLRHLSERGAEAVLQDVMFSVLRPRASISGDSRTKFVRRLNAALRVMRAALVAPLKEWVVTVQVFGLALQGLPFEFGGTHFQPGTQEATSTLANHLGEAAPTRRRSAKWIADRRRERAESRTEIVECFSGHPFASISVRAVDKEAASRLGTERIRRTVDVLNFFARLIQRTPFLGRAHVAPDGEEVPLARIVRLVNGHAFTFGEGGKKTRPIEMIEPSSTRAKEIGLSRADEILDRLEPTDFERRIVNALSWAGRATVERRSEQAFLLYAIALEALLAKPTARQGVTGRFALRTAHLLGETPEARRETYEEMQRLYELRSALVHAGDSSTLDDDDLRTMRQVTYAALVRVLTGPRFVAMRTAQEFDRWLDDRLLG